MSLTARLLGLTSGTRAAGSDPHAKAPKGGASTIWYSTPGQPQVSEWDGLTAVRNGYLASIYIMQPVRIIATALGSLPWRVGVDPDKRGDYDKTAPMAQLLGPPPGGPNPVTSPRALWVWSLVQRLVTGRMAWETVCPPNSDVPGALWPLVAPFLQPIPSGPNTPRWFDGFVYQLPTGRIDYKPQEVFYSWRPSQLDWRQPESALQAASMPASLRIALDRYMWSLAKNGLAAKKLVITPEFAEDDERRAWEEQFAAEFTGYDNGGRVMHGYYEDDPAQATAAGSRTPPIQVVDLASSPADAQVIEILKAARDDLMVTWKVPMSWMGNAAERTYENASQEAKNFWQGPVLELAEEVSDDANLTLAPRFGDGKAGWFDFSSVEALKGTSIFGPIDPVAAHKEGLIATEDWRNDVGLPPLPGDAAIVEQEALPAIDDTPGGTSKANFTRATKTEFKSGPVDAAVVHDLLEHAYPNSVLSWVADAKWTFDPAVPLDEIKMARRPGGRDQSKVEGIAQAVKDGQMMDPVVLVDTGEGKLVIADGYHRTLAFDRAGKRTIPALIGTGVGTSGPWDRDMHDAKKNRAAAEIETELAAMGYRVADSGHVVATERLMHYWAEGEGAAKIQWGVDGDFDRCRLHLGKYVPPEEVAGLCANLHKRATGAWPGHAASEKRGDLPGHKFHGNQWKHFGAELSSAAMTHGQVFDTERPDTLARLVRAVKVTGHARLRGDGPRQHAVADAARSLLSRERMSTGKHAVTVEGGKYLRVFDTGRHHATAPVRDALTESSTAGLLLPKGNPPRLVKAVQAHLYTASAADRRKCTMCGQGVTAKPHRLPRKKRNVRHAGAGHAPVPTGHHSAKRKATLAQVHGQADNLEPAVETAMRTLFAAQRKATVDRLNGRRGAQMLRAATQPPEPPDNGQPEQPAPLVDTAQVYDLTHWIDKTREALGPAFAAVVSLTQDRFGRQLGDHETANSLAGVRQALDKRLALLARTVSQTTFDQVAAVLRDGVASGQTVGQMTAALGKVFDDAEANRAPMISRTSVIGALNEAAANYAQGVPGLIAGKEWLSAHDNRVRETHRIADGQVRSLPMPFDVGGFPMSFPGDPAAPPDEVINCRCTTGYLTPAEYAQRTHTAVATAA